MTYQETRYFEHVRDNLESILDLVKSQESEINRLRNEIDVLFLENENLNDEIYQLKKAI